MSNPKEGEVAIPISNRSPQYNEEEDYEEPTLEEEAFSERKQLGVKLIIFILSLSFLIAGRFTVPDNEPSCIFDRVQMWLLDVNYFILHNTVWRNTMQIICSSFMDVMFLTTSGYWVLYGKSGRLMISTIFFYVVRALIQKVWESPFPAGFWWYDPGFPSLVVPYGRGSDFFFSGHIGFVVLCGSEWYKNGHKLITALIFIGGCYTAFVLMAYQVHYCIDIFTGIFFAHWCWTIYDLHKHKFDGFFLNIYRTLYSSITKKKITGEIIYSESAKSSQIGKL